MAGLDKFLGHMRKDNTEVTTNEDTGAVEDELYDEDDIYSDDSTEALDDNLEEMLYDKENEVGVGEYEAELYSSSDEEQAVRVDTKELKKKLDSLARAGCNIVVTGCAGSGTSSVAFNLATMLSRLWYSTLLVDLDTVERAQSYISAKSYDALGTDSLSLERVVNSGASLGGEIGVVRKDLYIVGLGAAVDAYEIDQTVKLENIAQFMGTAKSQFSFVVYDAPLDNIIKHSKELATLSDKLLLVMEASTSGIMKTISRVTNIEDEVLLHTVFGKATPVFNKASEEATLMGKKFECGRQGAKQIDRLIISLAGKDIGLHIAGMNEPVDIEFSKDYDKFWYTSNTVCETKSGEETYIRVIDSII